jgi:inhibitor of cysteine peptidase
MNKSKAPKIFLFCCLSVVLLVFIVGVGYLIYKVGFGRNEEVTPPPPTPTATVDLKRFTSEEDFKSYLQASVEMEAGGYGVTIGLSETETFEEDLAPSEAGEPTRVSDTTVQVRGVDEPDIVKTDGEKLYFSQQNCLYYWEYDVLTESEEETSSSTYDSETKIVQAYPPEDLEELSGIDKTGNLLLYEDTLIIFEYDNIYGYDISDSESPSKLWDFEFGSRSYLIDARLYNEEIYLILRTSIDTSHPCPITPLVSNGDEVILQCTDVLHPIVDVPVDSTFSILVLDPTKGEVDKKVSFVGSSSNSVVYMSTNALYVTYSYYEDFVGFFYDFFNEKCLDLVPSSVIDRLEKLQEYDISARSKYTELEVILEEWQASLGDDEQLEVENELSNRMDDYYTEHKRDLEKSGIVKVDISTLEISASSSVPGIPLNQFSLDEYEDHLRIATTIGWGVFGTNLEDSVSDVYVLDSNLDQTGTVQDLGEGERIYSVRFVQEKGYVVTFRETDPFYVLDLSDPDDPELKGELKIPGYSSYLHPISKDKILGIGKEGSKVKISLFDVSDPTSPTEAAKYELDEYWTDVLETHHAFLLDSKHEVFFMPGSKGGYVFSYANDKLKLEKAVSNIVARRAIYIEDFMYVIGEDKIVVLDESDWEVFKRMSFE